jgi:hypothetical protein
VEERLRDELQRNRGGAVQRPADRLRQGKRLLRELVNRRPLPPLRLQLLVARRNAPRKNRCTRNPTGCKTRSTSKDDHQHTWRMARDYRVPRSPAHFFLSPIRFVVVFNHSQKKVRQQLNILRFPHVGGNEVRACESSSCALLGESALLFHVDLLRILVCFLPEPWRGARPRRSTGTARGTGGRRCRSRCRAQTAAAPARATARAARQSGQGLRPPRRRLRGRRVLRGLGPRGQGRP